MDVFGFTIKRKKNTPDEKKGVVQVVVPSNTEGTRDIINPGALGGRFIEVYDSGVVDTDEFNLIKKYRHISDCTEVDKAISEIVNDAVTYEDNVPFPVKLNLDKVDLSKSVKSKMVEEFDNILYLLKFNDYGYELFRNWYVDGRIYFHLVVDSNNIKDGIQKIIHIDSLYIKKIRNITRDSDGIISEIEVFYVYKPPLMADGTHHGSYNYEQFDQALKFTEESVTYGTSGLMDADRKMIISHLQKAIKPSNQLAMLEDSMVVYRVARAPERRIFYIDVGNLPKTKAEEYLNSIMNRYRNQVVYDTDTGTIDESKRHMSMLEDFWLPRREGGRGTEIDTLQGGDSLGEMDDVAYFRHKLYESLNVPLGRLDNENSMFNLARDNEITREEIKFSKFINRLRNRFSRGVFSDIFRKQLIMKSIITSDDWDNIESHIMYQWEEDSHFAELKKLAMLKERIDIVESMDQMIDRYYSLEYIRSNILMQTEEEAKELEKQRDAEKDERDTTQAFNNMGQNIMAQQGAYGEYDERNFGEPEEKPEEKPEKDTRSAVQKNADYKKK